MSCRRAPSMRISGRLESFATVCGRGNVLSEIGVCSVVALGVGMFIGCKEQFLRTSLAQNRHADAGSERIVLKEFRCSWVSNRSTEVPRPPRPRWRCRNLSCNDSKGMVIQFGGTSTTIRSVSAWFDCRFSLNTWQLLMPSFAMDQKGQVCIASRGNVKNLFSEAFAEHKRG